MSCDDQTLNVYDVVNGKYCKLLNILKEIAYFVQQEPRNWFGEIHSS